MSPSLLGAHICHPFELEDRLVPLSGRGLPGIGGNRSLVPWRGKVPSWRAGVGHEHGEGMMEGRMALVRDTFSFPT